MSPAPKWVYLTLLGTNGVIYKVNSTSRFSAAVRFNLEFTSEEWEFIHEIWNHVIRKMDYL